MTKKYIYLQTTYDIVGPDGETIFRDIVTLENARFLAKIEACADGHPITIRATEFYIITKNLEVVNPL